MTLRAPFLSLVALVLVNAALNAAPAEQPAAVPPVPDVKPGLSTPPNPENPPAVPGNEKPAAANDKPDKDDGVLPARLPFDRYRSLISASPFAPATAPAPAPAAAPGFAQNLYLSGAGKIGNKDYASVVSRDGQHRYTLFLGEQGGDGMVLEKIDWAPQLENIKATVRLGSEVATLEFDQQVIRRNPATAAQPVSGGAPGRLTPPGRASGPSVLPPPPGANAGRATPNTIQRRRVKIVAPPQQ